MEKREVWLIWEINKLEGGQCLRAIDDDEVILNAHLRACRQEAESLGRQSKFFTEKVQINHAFGYNDMKAAVLILGNARSKP